MISVIVRDGDRSIVRYSTTMNLTDPGPGETVYTLNDSQLAKLALGAGGVRLNPDNITLDYSPLNLPPPPFIDTDVYTLPRFRLQTTDAAAHQLAAITLASQNTLYVAHISLFAIDAGNFNRRYMEAVLEVGRGTGGAIFDQVTVTVNHFNNATSQAWTVVNPPTVSGNDVIISVTGQAGRSIEWLMKGYVDRFKVTGL